jgi:hypothetical protein
MVGAPDAVDRGLYIGIGGGLAAGNIFKHQTDLLDQGVLI